MRYFLCAFDGFLLGVPIAAVSSLMIVTREFTAAVERDEEAGLVYYSLPVIFGRERLEARHGIILKPLSGGAAQITDARSAEEKAADAGGAAGAAREVKHVLLVPEVEREADIPASDVYRLPALLAGAKGLSVFTGIQFMEGDGTSRMILFIDPERFLRSAE